jgi:uncharacterized protein YkwD
MSKYRSKIGLVSIALAIAVINCSFSPKSNASVVRTSPTSDCATASQTKRDKKPSDRKTIIADANSVNELEATVYRQINEYRQSRNLSPLQLDDRISTQARIHSEAMAKGEVSFSHDRFEERTNSISQIIPYRSIAENVAYNKGFTDSATQAVNGWLKSSGHLQNIEGNFALTGIGVAKNERNEYYFTQIFVLQS